MYFNQFLSSLKTTSGYKKIEEARKHAREIQETQKLAEKIVKDTYQEISEHTVASIIKEQHNIKVTDTLIESYLELASSNMFTIDPVVHKIRSLNKLDKVVEGKLHYVLGDGSTVAINESTQNNLNKLLENQKEIIEKPLKDLHSKIYCIIIEKGQKFLEKLIKNNKNVGDAFRYMNKAMYLQQAHYQIKKGKYNFPFLVSNRLKN